MNRTPPIDVIRQLRREVGFGCPVPGCGSPYLTWHHFDPPWSEREHHDPNGMVALCTEHHGKADVGAFTPEQLRALKAAGGPGADVDGRFDWLRRDLIIRVGTNYYFETPSILRYGPHELIWFTRDDKGHFLANLRMITLAGEPRWVMRENFWMLGGQPLDVHCPPSGKLIDVRYRNGDRVMVEFRWIASREDADAEYPDFWPADRVPSYPATTCEITYRVAGTLIDIGPSHFRAGGLLARHCTFIRSGAVDVGGALEPAALPGRNDPCPCESGKKFKKCHGALGW